MPKSVESLKSLYLMLRTVYESDPSEFNRSLYLVIGDALDSAIIVQNYTEAVDYHYIRYLDLLNHP